MQLRGFAQTWVGEWCTGTSARQAVAHNVFNDGFLLSGELLQEQRSGAHLLVSLQLTGLELQTYRSSDSPLRRGDGVAPVVD